MRSAGWTRSGRAREDAVDSAWRPGGPTTPAAGPRRNLPDRLRSPRHRGGVPLTSHAHRMASSVPLRDLALPLEPVWRRREGIASGPATRVGVDTIDVAARVPPSPVRRSSSLVARTNKEGELTPQGQPRNARGWRKRNVCRLRVTRRSRPTRRRDVRSSAYGYGNAIAVYPPSTGTTTYCFP